MCVGFTCIPLGALLWWYGLTWLVDTPVNCFGVIYMDIMMPRMNGWDAARTIRAMNRPDAETVPIIAMSANAFSEDIMDSRLAGMDIHLAKPLDEAKMINALKQCIAERSAVKLRNDL